MIRVVGVLSCVVALLAACGDDAASPATSPAGSAPAPAVVEPDVVAVGVPPCDLVTAEEVAAATGLAVTEIRDEPPVSCVFDLGEAAGVAILVSVDDGQGRLGAPAALFAGYAALATEGNAEVIDDLGAAAAYSQGFRGLAIDAGDGRFIALAVNGGYAELSSPRGVLIELAEMALGRL